MKTRQITRNILVAGLALSLVACGKNNDNSNSTIVPMGSNQKTNNTTPGNNNTSPTNNTTPGNNTSPTNNTTPTNNTSPTNNTTPGNNTSPSNNIASVSACSEEGIVDASMTPQVFTGSTVDPSLQSSLATPCGFGAAPEQAFQFDFDKPTRVTASITGGTTSWVIDVRDGKCDASQSLICSAAPSRTFVVPAGESRLITIEPENNSRGEFELTVEFEELACLPIGGSVCAGDSISRCEQGGRAETVYECGAPCSMDACGGDMCENAVEVTSLPFRFEGKTTSYGDRLNFSDATECYYPDTEGEDGMGMGMPFSTVGEDATFLVKDLTAGQLLTVDARSEAGNQGDSAIFIMDTCDKSTCHIGRDLGDWIEKWEVPADGDYVVVVERRALSTADIVVDISVE